MVMPKWVMLADVNICFNGKSHCCKTDLQDVKIVSLIPKNIYSPVQYLSPNLLSYIY